MVSKSLFSIIYLIIGCAPYNIKRKKCPYSIIAIDIGLSVVIDVAVVGIYVARIRRRILRRGPTPVAENSLHLIAITSIKLPYETGREHIPKKI